MPDINYPHGKTLVRYFKRPKNGLQAEPNVKLPHVYIEHDGAIVEVSSELAWKLVMDGRAEMASPNAQAVVPKAESPAPHVSEPEEEEEEWEDEDDDEDDDEDEDE